MFPHERSLVKRLETKPFALIGVNSDKDKDDCKKKNVAEPIPGGASPIDGVQTYQVFGGEESEGVEISFTYQPRPNWQLQAGYTYDDVRINKTTDPTQLNAWNGNAPHHQANFIHVRGQHQGTLPGGRPESDQQIAKFVLPAG